MTFSIYTYNESAYQVGGTYYFEEGEEGFSNLFPIVEEEGYYELTEINNHPYWVKVDSLPVKEF